MRENARHASTGSGSFPMKRRPRSPAPQATRASPGQVRLIGGRWRGTRLPVADIDGLRPTPDRVRETVFNWLAPVLPGARVLDLFAGSGALGLESVSRGASSAVLVERDPDVVANLRALAGRLDGGDAVEVVQADALRWMHSATAGRFDIAFLDPPFASAAMEPALSGVLPLLARGGWLYIEGPASSVLQLPAPWQLHRDGRTRDTHFALHRHIEPDAKGDAPVGTLGPGTQTPPAAAADT